MRYLTDQTDQTDKEQGKEIAEQLQNIVVDFNSKIDELKQKNTEQDTALDQYKADNSDYIKTNELEANQATVSNITASTISTDEITSNQITGSRGDISNIYSDRATVSAIATDEITANQATATELTVSTIAANQITGNTGVFSNLTVSTFVKENESTDRLTASTIATDEITANQATATELTASTIATGEITATELTADTATAIEAELESIRNEQIWHRWNKQYLDQPELDDGYSVIEIPYTAQGTYSLTFRTNEDEEIFSIYVIATTTNLTFAYSRAAYSTNDPATLYDCKIRKWKSRPQLYIRTQRSGWLYWHYEGLDHLDDASPNSYPTWPFDISDETMSYICYHIAATVFTRHLDYGDNTSPAIGGASLYLIPSSIYQDTTEETVEYDTSTDAPFTVYRPDQSLNKDDNVEFNKLSVNELAIKSITEDFMFLRSRDDGTFEVVLAVDNDEISGVQDIDNPITARSVYNWNGIALGGEVTINGFITPAESKTIYDSTSNSIYRRTYYTLKEGTPTVESTIAFRNSLDASVLLFNSVEHLSYESRPYVKYSITTTGDYNGLYYSYFLDDGSLFETNQSSYDVSVWTVPSNIQLDSVFRCDYYATGKRYPIADDEGENEYHLKHLAGSTIVHGDLTVLSNLYVNGDLVTSSIAANDITAYNSLKMTDTTTSTVYFQADKSIGKLGTLNTATDIAGSTLTIAGRDNRINGDLAISSPNLNIEASSVVLTGNDTHIASSSLAVDSADIAITGSTTITGNTNITGSTVVNGNLTVTDVFQSNHITDGTANSTLFTMSELYANHTKSFFDTVDSAIVKANQLREKLSHVFLDNTNQESEVGIIATQADGTDIHLDIGEEIRFGTSGLQIPLAERAESSTLSDNGIAVWKGNKITTVNAVPTKAKQALVAEYTGSIPFNDNPNPSMADFEYHFDAAGGGQGTVIYLSTMAQLEERLAITDPEDDNYIPDGALVHIQEAEAGYIEAVEQ